MWGPRKRHTLLLPSRQLSRLRAQIIVEPHEIDHLLHALSALFFRESLYPEAEFDILANRHVRPEREVLKDHADPPLLWLAKAFPCGSDELIVNQNISRIGDDEAR